MITSKQRAYLRAMANTIETILIVGKGGISAEVIKQADDALTAREIFKGKVLETAEENVREIATFWRKKLMRILYKLLEQNLFYTEKIIKIRK